MEPPRAEVEIGKLISTEKVLADVFGLARRTRDRVLGLPDRLAPRITGLTDAAEIERLLTDEIRIACRELDEVCGARPAGSGVLHTFAVAPAQVYTTPRSWSCRPAQLRTRRT